jgi:CHAT domain-containing protein
MAVEAGAWIDAVLAAPERALAPALAETDAPTAHAAAWALKERCYEAWSTEPARARPCAQRLAELQALHPADAEVRALAAWTAGICALLEGRLADAVDRLEAAQGGFGRLGQVQHAAQTLVPQMVALAMLGREDQALQAGQRALALFSQAGDEVAAGKVELNLGTMLTRRDRHGEAALQYRRAAVRFARGRALEHSVLADLGLANALTWQFEFAEAQRVRQRALMRAQTHGLRVPEALAHLVLGRVALLQGHFNSALQALARASRMLKDAGAAPQQRLEADAALADTYLALNLLPEAVALYDRLADLAAEIDAPTERARMLLERSRGLARMGRAELANADLQAASELFAAVGNTASVAGAGLVLAARHLEASRTQEALAAARLASQELQDSGIVVWQLEAQALEAAALVQSGDAVAAGPLFESVMRQAEGLAPLQLSCRLGLARVARSGGDVRSATNHADTALQIVEDARSMLPADEFRAAVAAAAEQAHELWLELAVEQGEPSRVLQALERGRARALQLGLQRRPHSINDSDVGNHHRLQLRWLRQRWQEAVTEGAADRAADWVQRTRQLESELLEAHRRQQLAAVESQQPDVDAAAVPFDAAALQAGLVEGEAFVAFHVGKGTLLACVATAQGVHTLQWPVQGLAALVQGLRFQLEAVKYARAALVSHASQLQSRVQAHLQTLYRAIWAPLTPLLAGCSRVVIAPHRDLHYLPFVALHDGQQWLLERFEIELAPSAAVWLAGAVWKQQANFSLLALGSESGELPHVTAELDAVAAAYGHRALCLHGAAATSQALRQLATHVEGVDVLHLACHGEFRADNPAFSALHLADGPLALHELREMPLQTRLVVLSACETGQSRIAPGDELLGLVRGFMLAGAAQVLATLWSVDDAATAHLMGAFHARLAAGQRASEALRNAQRELAMAGLHPFFWAAWALHGRG